MTTAASPVLNLKRHRPASLRAWHWLNALVLLGLVSTMLLRKGFLSWRSNAALIEAKAQEAGVTLAPDLAKVMARSIRDVMWEWHYPLGFCLAGLILFRVVVAVVAGERPFRQVLDGFRAVAASDGAGKRDAWHFTAVRLVYGVFYACVLFMACTGITARFSALLGLGPDAVHQLEEVHETVANVFPVFIVLHVAGVVIAELTRYRGIVSDMIHGGERS
ncbi:MAG: cytochrome b/b6 domain-containing protein [Deltaproteobacteria bacterium]|nr:cytochrome b/b6 domain-containing protein [Deltaproteobacteria bacterium]